VLRAALFVTFLAGFAPGGDPVLVTTGKPVRTHQVVVDAAPAAFFPLAQQGWSAIWDRDTGAPARIFGSHLDVPGSSADGAIAEAAAKKFIDEHRALFAGDFVVSGNSVDARGLRTVGFQQQYRGLRVIGGQLGFVFSHDRLFVISSDALPDVHVAMAASHIDVARVEKWVAAAPTPTGERAVLPLIRTGGVEYVLVDVVDAGAYHVYVDPSGAPIARAVRWAFDGAVDFNAGVRYATSTRMDFPASELGITANGNSVQTAVDGSFAFTGSSATVVTSLAGARVRIVNAAGALASKTLTVQAGGSASWNDMDTEAVDAEISTYVYGNQIKARDRLINPAVAKWIDTQLDFHVNENDVCNAYSTGDDVHFYRKSAQCQNTGRIADVVYHEFGHSFHNHSVVSGMGAFPGTMSEGFSDFNAANYTEDSGIARGFDYTDNPGREIDPVGTEKAYPGDLSVDPHESGKIISGALWDLRKAAIIAMGHDEGVKMTENVFLGVMERSADFPTAYNSALIADDDDGDLGNGTPHQCMIAAAFAPHGLVEGFETTTVGAPTLTGMNISVPVMRPTNGTCTAPAVTKATLTWSANGGATTDVALTASGDNYVGAIPAQPDGTLVTYSVLVTLDNGASFGFPDNQADPKYQLYVGPVQPIYCANMDTDPMWTQTTNKGSQQWVLAPPGLDPTTTDPKTTHTGTKVYGNNLGAGGNYPANIMTSVQSGVIDTSKFDHVRLQYWRWLTVEQALYDQATIEINGASMWSNDQNLVFLDKEWRFQDIDLGKQASVQIGFTLASDDSQQYGGWTVDDVCIVGIKTPVCGDGVLDSGETCDDGNVAGGDGCSSSCQVEDEMPMMTDGGGCCSAQRSGSGSALLAFGVGLALRKRRRGRALKG